MREWWVELCEQEACYTFLNLGFLRLADLEAPLELLARIAPAASLEIPSLEAILACMALKPGCELAI